MTGLEAYEIIKDECRYAFGQTANGDRVRESLPIIEKELKALEIIRKNNIDVGIFKRMLESIGINYTLIKWRDYSDNRLYIGEINLLKEVL